MDMDIQPEFDLDTTLCSDDMYASYLPASFDDYLVQAKMRHTGSRPDTKSKLQSDYDEPQADAIYFFAQLRYKALPCILRRILTTPRVLCRSAPPRAPAATF